MCCGSFFCFFFSSRRRHTRYIGDWSSDVCSSDLRFAPAKRPAGVAVTLALRGGGRAQGELLAVQDTALVVLARDTEIGRASCRERVERQGGGGAVTKKKKRERDI